MWIKRVQALVFALMILGMSSIPSRDLPETDLPGLDKALHFTVYGGLGALLARAGWGGPAGWMIGAAWGALDETYQRLTPGRSPDWLDWMADLLGVAFGCWAWSRCRVPSVRPSV